MIIGSVLILGGFIFGYLNGLIILIVGIIFIVFGLRDKEEKRIKEINYILAGDEAKRIKTTHKVRKILCTKCGEEVKESWNKCKKCKNLLYLDGAVKIKNVDVED